MNRRRFLQCLGVFAASATLPSALLKEGICRAPAWAKDLPKTLFRTAPLAAGRYTFSGFMGELGLYVGGVTASGGETLIEMPFDEPIDRPRLVKGGIVIPTSSLAGDVVDFMDEATRDAMIRGVSVERA